MQIEPIIEQPQSPGRLYLATLFIELVVGFFRGTLLAALFAAVALGIQVGVGGIWRGINYEGSVVWWAALGYVVGYANIITSLLVFLGYGGGSLLTRSALGARRLSLREAESIKETLDDIQRQSTQPLKSFSKLYAIDSVLEYVFLVGTTLYVSSAAARGDQLRVLLAHEMGHIQNGDGGVILALRRLVLPPFQLFNGQAKEYTTKQKKAPQLPLDSPQTATVGQDNQLSSATLSSALNQEFGAMIFFYAMALQRLQLIFGFIGGGLGVWFFSSQWAGYFRERDYFADDFVCSVGFGGELLEYLERNIVFSFAVPYSRGWQPSHELRIDRLLRLGQGKRATITFQSQGLLPPHIWTQIEEGWGKLIETLNRNGVAASWVAIGWVLGVSLLADRLERWWHQGSVPPMVYPVLLVWLVGLAVVGSHALNGREFFSNVINVHMSVFLIIAGYLIARWWVGLDSPSFDPGGGVGVEAIWLAYGLSSYVALFVYLMAAVVLVDMGEDLLREVEPRYVVKRLATKRSLHEFVVAIVFIWGLMLRPVLWDGFERGREFTVRMYTHRHLTGAIYRGYVDSPDPDHAEAVYWLTRDTDLGIVSEVVRMQWRRSSSDGVWDAWILESSYSGLPAFDVRVLTIAEGEANCRPLDTRRDEDMPCIQVAYDGRFPGRFIPDYPWPGSDKPLTIELYGVALTVLPNIADGADEEGLNQYAIPLGWEEIESGRVESATGRVRFRDPIFKRDHILFENLTLP